MAKNYELDSETIFSMVFDLVTNFSKLMSFDERLEKLKTIEFYVLIHLALKGPKKMTDLARAFSMTKSNVTLIVDSMESNGLLCRKRAVEDRRVYLIHLTETGQSIYRSLLKGFDRIIKKFTESIDPEDLQLFASGFEKIMKLVVYNQKEPVTGAEERGS
ncbi:MAG TPA: MarR family transcriptional regulator [Kosmotogaceae bacterium]|nr:MarR family transcriptional regulator [Kosmotogaceae bacterium]